MRKITWLVCTLILLVASVSAGAQYVENHAPYNAGTMPHGVSGPTASNINAILRDIAMKSKQAEVRFVAISESDIQATGFNVPLESYRDSVIAGLSDMERQTRLVFVLIWVADQDVMWVSVPDRAFDRISMPMVGWIIQSEFADAVLAGEDRQSALFDTVSRLSRYLTVATDTYPEYSQSWVPSGVPNHSYYLVHEMEPVVPVYDLSNDVEDIVVSTTPQMSPAPAPAAQTSSSNMWLIITVLAVVLLVVLLFVMKKKRAAADDGVYEHDDDEDDDDLYDD